MVRHGKDGGVEKPRLYIYKSFFQRKIGGGIIMAQIETKTNTMRIATEKIVESKTYNVKGKIAQQKLENQIKAIDAQTEERIKEIKLSPIDEDMQIKQAEADYQSQVSGHARARIVTIQNAEAAIKQAELDVEEAKKEADAQLRALEVKMLQIKTTYEKQIRQAELTAQTKRDSLNQVKEIAKETEERNNLRVKQELQAVLNSVKDTEKAMQRRIDKEIAAGERKKLELQQELELLKIQNEEQGSGEKHWQKLYEDVVAISKAQQGE